MPRIFTVGKEFRFEAAHSLPHLPEGHKCKRQHGHSYRFRVDISGPVDGRGFVIDYAEIHAAIFPLVEEKLDHRMGRCHRITLWETPTSVVICEEGGE